MCHTTASDILAGYPKFSLNEDPGLASGSVVDIASEHGTQDRLLQAINLHFTRHHLQRASPQSSLRPLEAYANVRSIMGTPVLRLIAATTELLRNPSRSRQTARYKLLVDIGR